MNTRSLILYLTLFLSCQNSPSQSSPKVWQTDKKLERTNPNGQTIATRFTLPESFIRESLDSSSFGHFLRHFPLKPTGEKVLLFNGSPKFHQHVHAAVLDIDVGNRDLQQCADAVMRLRAEYLWEQQAYDQISFNFTNGFKANYSNWRNNQRIRVQGNKVSWVPTSRASKSYNAFRKYLNMVFAYAGTLSLAQELKPQSLDQIQIGDVFIQGGSPGHAVIVVDRAINPSTKEVLVLLAQSYMPAQNIHVLKNLNRSDLSPWYPVKDLHREVLTPEWRFEARDLKAF